MNVSGFPLHSRGVLAGYSASAIARRGLFFGKMFETLSITNRAKDRWGVDLRKGAGFGSGHCVPLWCFYLRLFLLVFEDLGFRVSASAWVQKGSMGMRVPVVLRVYIGLEADLRPYLSAYR